MTNIIKLTTADDEPRVRDLDLAKALEFTDAHKIRNLIARNRDELETHGRVSATLAETTSRGGRPGKAYYLNEPQALVICALSRTPVAVEVRRQLIQAFMAYRNKPVVVREHRRALPVKPATDTHRERMISFIRAFRDQPDVLADWIIGAVDEMGARLIGRP